MKRLKHIIGCTLLAPGMVLAQKDVRTVKTTVADVLVLLPANDSAQAANIYNQLIKLTPEGFKMISDQVQPNGATEGIASRYAVSMLTHQAKTAIDKAKVEQAWLSALSKAKGNELKAYFIANLQLVGGAASVKPLSSYIATDSLADAAITALTAINSPVSKKALADALPAANELTKPKLVKALGHLQYLTALPAITALSKQNSFELRKQSLWAIAAMGQANSYTGLLQQARNVSFKPETTGATDAFVYYMQQVAKKGNAALANKISTDIINNTPNASQQQYRLAALEYLPKATALPVLVGELSKFDASYRRQVLDAAVPYSQTPAAITLWDATLQKSGADEQADILAMLAKANRTDAFISSHLLPALASPNKAVRIQAATDIAFSKNKKYAEALTSYLLKAADAEELAAAKTALLQVTDKDNASIAAAHLSEANTNGKIALLQVLAARRATNQFNAVAHLTNSNDAAVKKAALEALPNTAAADNINALLSMLSASSDEATTKALQQAIINAMDKNSAFIVTAAYQNQQLKLLPVLPYSNDKQALGKVLNSFANGNGEEKAIAFAALENWQNQDAVRSLLGIIKNNDLSSYKSKAFDAYIKQTIRSNWPDDQKLLMLEQLMPEATTTAQKNAVLKAIGSTRTFLALMYVSQYLDDADLSAAAARSAMQIALPTGDGLPGLEGAEVRKVLGKVLGKLTGGDSQYERIDIQTYLAKMPTGKGYETIFNGKDLTGWQGLVENPIARSKMSKEELAQKQAAANEKLKANWTVHDGAIWFTGKGDNLSTIKHYADFELLADWRITKEGDSGFYLRGSPQVQIWDTSRTDVGAQVGSGGLYNNQKNPSKPLVLADNAIGEWNTFRIKMVGDKVTVYLNGQLVVDNVTLENYWDRKLPIFSSEAIELQAHGTELAFRNLYIKELGGKPYELSSEEKSTGFELLFNGKDLNNWTGNKTDYVVEDNAIAIYPTGYGHGDLFTQKEYSDFVFRFSFQLTPGANNGIGIHAPLEGDAAYVGKEIQVLDNDAPVYANLEKYQYHGSVYGIIPAKRGFLKPLGEWNEEEIYVKGDNIKVTLNGTVILEGNIKEASANGTLDHKDHPGLLRHTGHIGFLGHGSVVKFKDLRIKSL